MWPFSRIIVANDGPFFYVRKLSAELQEYFDRILPNDNEWKVYVQIPIIPGKIPFLSTIISFIKALWWILFSPLVMSKEKEDDIIVIVVFERNIGENRFDTVVLSQKRSGRRKSAFPLTVVKNLFLEVDVFLNPVYYRELVDGETGKRDLSYLQSLINISSDISLSEARTTTPEERSKVSSLQERRQSFLRLMRDSNPATAFDYLNDLRVRFGREARAIKTKFYQREEEERKKAESLQQELEEVAENFDPPPSEAAPTDEMEAYSVEGGEVGAGADEDEDEPLEFADPEEALPE
ncbi:hypothetical protein KKH43_05865 [Patescibacteria group bacterium]|nr:hypothetical protein [Patescibacteria group bacterium]